MNKETFSLILLPPKGKKSYSIRFSPKTAVITAALVLIGITAIGTGIFLSTQKGAAITQYRGLKAKTAQQEQEIKDLKQQLQDMNRDIERLVDKEEEIRTIIGKTRFDSRRFRRLKKKFTNAKKFRKAVAKTHKDGNTNAVISLYTTQLNKLKKSFDTLDNYLSQMKSRFAATPSIYPLYGRIQSSYGPRRHPVTGKRRFHKGIDIPSWIGAPIKATADGIVEYAGWSGTFGNVVVIDHNFGYRTIYAHASQLLVKKREVVKKGQIIAQVGQTGLSTGPHIHYEIRQWRKAVNPRQYLELDMFTASTRVW